MPGAADNLSASAVAVALCRFLVDNPSQIPEDTEIRFISFGSEEAGLRGSRRYVARHLDELKRLDARVLNYEIVAYPVISILTSLHAERGITVLLVTHDINIAHHCQRIIHLKDGEIVTEESL